MRTAIIPPTTAQCCPAGCSINTTVPGSVQSTQCFPAGKVLGSGVDSGGLEDLGMNFMVEAGATILGVVVVRPIVGEKGARCFC